MFPIYLIVNIHLIKLILAYIENVEIFKFVFDNHGGTYLYIHKSHAGGPIFIFKCSKGFQM